MDQDGVVCGVGQDGEDLEKLRGAEAEGVLAEADQATGRHDFVAEDGDGPGVVAESHEGDEFSGWVVLC